jgi:hypothetical protein
LSFRVHLIFGFFDVWVFAYPRIDRRRKRARVLASLRRRFGVGNKTRARGRHARRRRPAPGLGGHGGKGDSLKPSGAGVRGVRRADDRHCCVSAGSVPGEALVLPGSEKDSCRSVRPIPRSRDTTPVSERPAKSRIPFHPGSGSSLERSETGVGVRSSRVLRRHRYSSSARNSRRRPRTSSRNSLRKT